MSDAERLERILDVVAELKDMSRDRILFVEGTGDVRALNALGIHGDMFTVQASGGPMRAAEYAESSGKGSVILTDWDRRGDTLAEQLRSLLPPGTADTRLRQELAHLCGFRIRDVESLDVYVGSLRSRTSPRPFVRTCLPGRRGAQVQHPPERSFHPVEDEEKRIDLSLHEGIRNPSDSVV